MFVVVGLELVRTIDVDTKICLDGMTPCGNKMLASGDHIVVFAPDGKIIESDLNSVKSKGWHLSVIKGELYMFKEKDDIKVYGMDGTFSRVFETRELTFGLKLVTESVMVGWDSFPELQTHFDLYHFNGQVKDVGLNTPSNPDDDDDDDDEDGDGRSSHAWVEPAVHNREIYMLAYSTVCVHNPEGDVIREYQLSYNSPIGPKHMVIHENTMFVAYSYDISAFDLNGTALSSCFILPDHENWEHTFKQIHVLNNQLWVSTSNNKIYVLDYVLK